MCDLYSKREKLIEELQSLGNVAIAFSGGVDSAFLLQSAIDALGVEKVIAITARLSSAPANEVDDAEGFCQDRDIRQTVFDFDVLDVEGFKSNPPDRCYICKLSLLGKLKEVAKSKGFDHVAEGSNTDDASDYRPGFKAVTELGVLSPLLGCGLTKAEIRELSREMGLPTWDKPSLACLASRFVYGEGIDESRLRMVGEAERLILNRGFTQVRVRVHGEGDAAMARIEVAPEEFGAFLEEDVRDSISDELKALGFAHVSLDLEGYRTGSMNGMLKTQ